MSINPAEPQSEGKYFWNLVYLAIEYSDGMLPSDLRVFYTKRWFPNFWVILNMHWCSIPHFIPDLGYPISGQGMRIKNCIPKYWEREWESDGMVGNRNSRSPILSKEHSFSPPQNNLWCALAHRHEGNNGARIRIKQSFTSSTEYLSPFSCPKHLNTL